MINAQDIKNGTCIRMDGKLYFCIEFLHVKPGKGNTFMRTKLKDVVSGYVLERRFNIGEKLEDVRVERRPYQFLYKEGEDYIFMNQETFDQHPIAHDLINGVDFLLEGMTLDVNYSMTSFFTTGGIRGGKKKMDKFYPRSFNMGVRREVYQALGGFSNMRFGEDIDFSIRIFKGGYQCRLFPDAWVYHKRRTDFKKFFKQVHNPVLHVSISTKNIPNR